MKKIINLFFICILVCFFVFSIVDTNETKKKTNFNQTNIEQHIEKLSENGPRSIMDKEANQKALEYLITAIESYGIVEGNTVEKPAYIVQDYVAEDDEYQNWYLSNLIVHIPANAENKTNNAVMFMGHFDSVPMGQGSSDDGVSCSVMLEAIRYYLEKIENGYELANDLVFAFVNGEEFGLYGSVAMYEEFNGFNNVIERTKFVTNLESRGTSGTLIMFETGRNNYNTIKLFQEVNKSVFSCSIATLVYDIMPNNTDFSTFKDAYQGINMANIGSGENYHTQNDSPENVGKSYLSQQAQIVDGLIDKLSNYELEKLYDANESAIFFSYLNFTTVVYNHMFVIILAVIGILMIVTNIVLSKYYKKENNLIKTFKSILVIVCTVVITAVLMYICYYLFQLIAVIFGVIDIHMIGTITYSNTAIVIGMAILTLFVVILCCNYAYKWFKVESRDLIRAFSYVHMFLGIVISFILPDASYLFIFSGIMFLVNELLITCIKKINIASYHGELLATALYFPIVIPVIFLATSALGMTMAYVYGIVLAVTMFAVGVYLHPLCKYFSVRSLYKMIVKKIKFEVSNLEGACHILLIGIIILFVVCVIPADASVNLQGKQNIAKLPWDDALIYVLDENNESEYRIYDLNAYNSLKKYAPKMTYMSEYYVAEEVNHDISVSVLTTSENNMLTVKKYFDKSIVYLTISTESATSIVIDDGITSKVYNFNDDKLLNITIHSNCTVKVIGGTATIEYKEVIRDYETLIPSDYENDENKLHFNLWLTKKFVLEE